MAFIPECFIHFIPGVYISCKNKRQLKGAKNMVWVKIDPFVILVTCYKAFFPDLQGNFSFCPKTICSDMHDKQVPSRFVTFSVIWK